MSMAKDTKFRFGVHTHSNSQDMNHEIFFSRKLARPVSRDLSFLGLKC